MSLLTPLLALADATVATSATKVPGPGVVRIGINLGSEGIFGGGVYRQNFLDDPGFEPPQACHVIIPSAASSTSITDSNQYSTDPSGFWNGATGCVRTGVDAGTCFNVGAYTSGGTYSGSGYPTGLITTERSKINADLITECITDPKLGSTAGANLAAGWAISDTHVTLSTTTAYQGHGSAQISVSDGNAHSLHMYGDSENGSVGSCSTNAVALCSTSADCDGNVCRKPPLYPWHPIAGPFQMSVYALASGTSGTSTLTLQVQRFSSSWVSISHTFNLAQDGAWHHYNFSFTGADKASDVGIWEFTVIARDPNITPGAKVYVDNAFLGPSTGGAGGSRSELMQTLKTLKPGTLRYMDGAALNENEVNFDAADDLRVPSSNAYVRLVGWIFGIQDVYAVAGAIGAGVHATLPNTFNDNDFNNFAAHLCAAFHTHNLPVAIVESNNEEWNGASGVPGADAHASTNGFANAGGSWSKMWNRNFELIASYMSAHCLNYASRTFFEIGGQEANIGVIYYTSGNLPHHNPQYGGTVADYVMGGQAQATGTSTTALAQQGMCSAINQFEPLATTRTLPGCSGFVDNSGGDGTFANVIPETITNLCGNQTPCSQFLGIYENGNGNQLGSATPVEAYNEAAGWIAAGFNSLDWILGFQAGSNGLNSGTLKPLLDQNTFNLGQLQYTTSGGATSAIWGIVHDFDSQFGPKWSVNNGHIRPIGLALALGNKAIQQGGEYHQVTRLPAGVYCDAFRGAGGGNWSLWCANMNSSPQTFTVDFPPSGLLPKSCKAVLNTHSIRDNNENTADVYIGNCPGSISVSGRNLTITNMQSLGAEALPAQDAAASTLISTPAL